MFDNVGRSRQQSAGRTAGSIFLSLALNASVFGVMLVVTVKAPEIAEEVKAKLVAVDMAPPPPPPPPPPPAGGSKKKKKEEEKVETPEVVPETPQILEEAPPPVEEEDDGGVEGGVEGGVKDGVVGGVVGGVKDGVLGGELGGTGVVKTVHYTEVQVKTRGPKPEFPQAAQQLGLRKEKCIVHIVVGLDGAPEDITFKACPELFKESARRATEQWRWYPLMEEGRPVRAQFDINYLFNLTD